MASKKPELPSITLDLLAEHQEELKKAFDSNETIGYAQVRFTQLSIARHYGGANVNGKRFIYNPVDDSLIRADVVKWMTKLLRDKAKAKKPKAKPRKAKTK